MAITPVTPSDHDAASPSPDAKARRRVLPAGVRALQHRNYRLFFAGQSISLVGSWMQSMAQAWLVYRLTGSPVLLGLAGFADKFPIFLLGLAGGLAADRWDRHRLVVVTQSLLMLQALALGLLVMSDNASVEGILILATLAGVINAFDLPARQSFIAVLVDQDDLPNALALNSSLFNAARILGPALAGVVVAAIGEGACFLLNSLSYVAVLVCLLWMRVGPRTGTMPHIGTLQGLSEGIRFAWGTPPVRALLALLGLTAVCGIPYIVLMPIMAGEVLGNGAGDLAVLMAAAGLGAFLGAVRLARRRSVLGLGRVVAYASVGFGIGLILFALSSSFTLSCAILAVVGFSMITQAAATNQLLQSLTPDPLRGRVMSFYTIMFVGMAPFGSILAGLLARSAGAPATVAAGGLLCAAAGLAFASRIGSLRRHVKYAVAEAPAQTEQAEG